jgi:hypothetical protein
MPIGSTKLTAHDRTATTADDIAKANKKQKHTALDLSFHKPSPAFTLWNMPEWFTKWVGEELRELRKAPTAAALLAALAIGVGWWAARAFDAERVEVLKLQVAALERGITAVIEPARADSHLPWILGLAALGTVTLGAAASAIRNKGLVESLQMRDEVTIYSHVLAGVNEQLIPNINEVFERIGWRPKPGETNLTQHRVGIRIIGGAFEQRENAWLCLKAIDVDATLVEDEDNLPPGTMQVVVGQPDPRVELNRTMAARQYAEVASQRDSFQQSLMGAQNECLQLKGELGNATKRHNTLTQEYAVLKREFTLERFRRYTATITSTQMRVVIKTAGYLDWGLVQQIKALFEGVNWPVALDPNNEPPLMPLEQFKVVLRVPANLGFEHLQSFLDCGDGKLLDCAVGITQRRDSENNLIGIEVLPTVST